jgi:hypothetical protein
MKMYITAFIFFGLIVSCTNSYNKSNESTGSESFGDEVGSSVFNGGYCAEVTYSNSNTGRESDYTLTIDVHDNVLERINFPNGWMDEDDFGSVELDENGYVSFTSNRGYDYTVQIIGEASGCFESTPRAVQCMGITEDGEQCEHLTDNPSGYCWQHEDQE